MSKVKKQAVHDAICSLSGVNMDIVRTYKPFKDWIKRGVVACRSLDLTWRESGQAFGLSARQAYSMNRSYLPKLVDNEEELELLTDLISLASDNVARSGRFHPSPP